MSSVCRSWIRSLARDVALLVLVDAPDAGADAVGVAVVHAVASARRREASSRRTDSDASGTYSPRSTEVRRLPSVFSREFWSNDNRDWEADLNAMPQWQQLVFLVIALGLMGMGLLLALSPFAVAYLIVGLTGLPNNPLVLSLIVVLLVAVYLRFRSLFVAAFTALSQHWRRWLVRHQRGN